VHAPNLFRNTRKYKFAVGSFFPLDDTDMYIYPFIHPHTTSYSFASTTYTMTRLQLCLNAVALNQELTANE